MEIPKSIGDIHKLIRKIKKGTATNEEITYLKNLHDILMSDNLIQQITKNKKTIYV